MTDQIYADGVFDGFMILVFIALLVLFYWLIFELPGIIRRKLGRREKTGKRKKSKEDKPERLMRSDYCKACQTVCSLEIENQQLRRELEMANEDVSYWMQAYDDAVQPERTSIQN